jgi:predicted transcriptional regulator
MAEEPPPRIDLDQVAEIVSSYVRHHQIAADQLAGLIVEVHRALAGLGRATPAQEPPEPAVPIRRSVQQECRLPRVPVSRADAPPPSADRPRPRSR